MNDYDSPIERVRKRVSYRDFKALYERFRDLGLTKPKVKEALKLVHQEIDHKRGYGSEQNSYYAYESMEQVCADNKVGVC